jgi:mono/diheme cytochrome c family protein
MRNTLPLLAFTLALGAACSPSETAPVSGGQAYFKALNCRACHRIGGEGAGRGGPDLTMTGFHKNAAWLDRFLKDPQAWRPGTMMPDPKLSDKARAAIVEYLASLKGEAWKGQRPWNAPEVAGDALERGHVLYARAGCVTCHGVGGKGGYPNTNVLGGKIPALTDLAQRYTKAELKTKIARGVVPQKADPGGPEPLLKMPAWAETLGEDEIGAVVEYLWALKGAAASGDGW